MSQIQYEFNKMMNIILQNMQLYQLLNILNQIRLSGVRLTKMILIL